MQKISRPFIDELQKTVNIVDFMEKEYDADFIFSKSSDWANTRCPMPNHDDGNPSFGVNQTNNTYNCFGCNSSGDLIKLVQDVEGLNFIEAIEKLSKFAGIDVETTNLDMKYLLNELTSNINQKLTKENTSNFPGSLSEIGFLSAVSQKLKGYSRKYNDSSFDEWIDLQYAEIDQAMANNNFKIINNFWYSIGKKAKDKYKEIVNGQAV
jgi:DNA primase